MFCCCIYLTFYADRGSLFPLLPNLFMEYNRPPVSPVAEHTPVARERGVEAESRGLLQRLHQGVRAKVLAVGLVIGGAAFANDKADAATMVPASVTRGFDLHELPDDAAGFQLDQISIRTGNAEDGNMDEIDFVTFTRPNDEYSFDQAIDYNGDVSLTVLSPNAVSNDGITSQYLMLVGDISTFQDARTAVIGSSTKSESPGLFNTLEGTEVHVGFGGSFEGDPLTATTPEELMAMYNGRVLEAVLPENINVDDHYIIHGNSPEPSTLAMLGTAAVAAAGLRRRRKTQLQ